MDERLDASTGACPWTAGEAQSPSMTRQSLVRLLSGAVISSALAGCNPARAPAPAPTSQAAPSAAAGAQPQGAAVKTFGAAISKAGASPVASVFANPEAFDGKTVIVDGAVRAACQRKGCWMELAPSLEHSAPGCRVTFKDYGFFVPTNSMGSHARVEGVVAVRTIDPAEVAHLESEGGSFPNKASDGSAKELRIVATGVELRRD